MEVDGDIYVGREGPGGEGTPLRCAAVDFDLTCCSLSVGASRLYVLFFTYLLSLIY